MFGLNDREMNREIERMRDEEHCGSTDKDYGQFNEYYDDFCPEDYSEDDYTDEQLAEMDPSFRARLQPSNKKISKEMEDIFNAPYDEIDYKDAEMMFGLSKKDIDLMLSVDLTKEESVIPTNNDSKEESKMTTTNLNKVLKKDLIQMVADLQAELAAKAVIEVPVAKAVSVQPTQITNKGDVTVKTTRQGRFTQEEMAAMKAAAMAGNKAVSAPKAPATKATLLSIDSDVAKSILINFNKADHAWASAKQMTYMKYKAVKGNIQGLTVPAGAFVIPFQTKESIEYFVCTTVGVMNRYRVVGDEIVEVKANRSVSGTQHPNKAFTMADGTKVGVTCKESNGLKSGEIVYANGTRFAYQWNNGKYNMPRVTGAGFASKDLPVMKSLLLAYFNEVLNEAPIVTPVVKEEVKVAPAYKEAPVVEVAKHVAETEIEYFDPELYA